MFNLVKAINCMKTFDIQELNSVREIDNYLKFSKTYNSKLSSSNKLFNKTKLNYYNNYKVVNPKYNKNNNNVNYNDEVIEKPKSVFLNNNNNNSKNISNNNNIQQISNCNLYNNNIDNDYSYSIKNLSQRESNIDQIMNNFAKQAELFKLASQGDESLINKFKSMIMDDAKRNIFSKSEKHYYFVNQPNTEGFTLLYEACFNGHLKYVKVLIDCDADHLIKCGTKKDEAKLSVLDAAIRWNHIKVVNYLIQDNEFNLLWPKEYIKSGIKIATIHNNKKINIILKKKLNSMKTNKGCFLLCGS